METIIYIYLTKNSHSAADSSGARDGAVKITTITTMNEFEPWRSNVYLHSTRPSSGVLRESTDAVREFP
jgi:hypothetical protein